MGILSNLLSIALGHEYYLFSSWIHHLKAGDLLIWADNQDILIDKKAVVKQLQINNRF